MKFKVGDKVQLRSGYEPVSEPDRTIGYISAASNGKYWVVSPRGGRTAVYNREWIDANAELEDVFPAEPRSPLREHEVGCRKWGDDQDIETCTCDRGVSPEELQSLVGNAARSAMSRFKPDDRVRLPLSERVGTVVWASNELYGVLWGDGSVSSYGRDWFNENALVDDPEESHDNSSPTATADRDGRPIRFPGIPGMHRTTSGMDEEDSGMVRSEQGHRPRFDLLWTDRQPYEDQFLTRMAVVMREGMEMYAERNWELGDSDVEYQRARSSAARHFAQWMSDEDDEDHGIKVAINIMFAEYYRWRINNGA
jgi:hypothetical protein